MSPGRIHASPGAGPPVWSMQASEYHSASSTPQATPPKTTKPNPRSDNTTDTTAAGGTIYTTARTVWRSQRGCDR